MGLALILNSLRRGGALLPPFLSDISKWEVYINEELVWQKAAEQQ